MSLIVIVFCYFSTSRTSNVGQPTVTILGQRFDFVFKQIVDYIVNFLDTESLSQEYFKLLELGSFGNICLRFSRGFTRCWWPNIWWPQLQLNNDRGMYILKCIFNRSNGFPFLPRVFNFPQFNKVVVFWSILFLNCENNTFSSWSSCFLCDNTESRSQSPQTAK